VTCFDKKEEVLSDFDKRDGVRLKFLITLIIDKIYNASKLIDNGSKLIDM
jgi:hypothetical protein